MMSGGDNAAGFRGMVVKIRHALRLRISAKILIYFLVIALIPLIAVSYVLVTAAHSQLQSDIGAKQQAVATDLARRVDNYVANNVNLLTYQARLISASQWDTSDIDRRFTTLFNQNSNLRNITVISTNGYQKRADMVDGKLTISDTVVDKAATGAIDFLEDADYLISIGRDGENPQATIGVPVFIKYDEASSGLFAAPKGKLSNISGGIIAEFDMGDIWKSVLSEKVGEKGYAYLVDAEGLLVTHPDRKFLVTHSQMEKVQAVNQFLKGNLDTSQTISETNQEVISTPHKTATGWAVIVEEPVSSIYADVNSYIQLAITVGISAIVLSIVVGLFFSRRLIVPIRKLTSGAKKMSRGDFEHTIDTKGHDELQELAETFNVMSASIKRLVGDMKQNNLRLKFEQMKLSNIISSVSDGVVAINSKGEILSINPPAAQLVGKAESDLIGKPLGETFKWEHDGVQFIPDITNGGIYHYTDLMLYRNESIAYMDLMVAVLEHKDSDVAAIVTIHDQTESRELSFMKLDFVAIAAHELRTPLTVIRGYLDMLSMDAHSQLSIYNLENLQKAITGANQLRDLINKLLNIARIERGDMEIFIEKLNLTKLTKENVEQHQSMAGQKMQIIRFIDETDDEIYVPADSSSMVEVLNNLIGNAIKYTEKGGKIKVKLSSADGFARVDVVDNGPGIPDELRERLFTKFYRAERSLISGSRGTGLGLFISRTIIELQHGEIGIAPDKGDGSTFYFTLPLYDPERDDELIAKKSSGGIRGWFKKRPHS